MGLVTGSNEEKQEEIVFLTNHGNSERRPSPLLITRSAGRSNCSSRR